MKYLFLQSVRNKKQGNRFQTENFFSSLKHQNRALMHFWQFLAKKSFADKNILRTFAADFYN
jgi:hypothetical protein